MKPRVMLPAVFTAAAGLVIARRHLDPLLGSIAVLAIAAGAGAAGVINMWYDADIAPGVQSRGRISRAEALAFGLILACNRSRGSCSRDQCQSGSTARLPSSSMSLWIRCG